MGWRARRMKRARYGLVRGVEPGRMAVPLQGTPTEGAAEGIETRASMPCTARGLDELP